MLENSVHSNIFIPELTYTGRTVKLIVETLQ